MSVVAPVGLDHIGRAVGVRCAMEHEVRPEHEENHERGPSEQAHTFEHRAGTAYGSLNSHMGRVRPSLTWVKNRHAPGKPTVAGKRRTVVVAEVINPGERGGVVDRVSADDAVTTLYTAHYRSLVRLSALLLGDAAVAEEVVQDAFVAMHGKWGRLREPEKAAAYLRQAVVNRSRSALRRRGVEERHLQVSNETGPSAEHSALHTLERDAVMSALRSLPQRQREVLVLRYYADLSEADIAGAMGISQGAVKSHASRGIAALRNVLESAQ